MHEQCAKSREPDVMSRLIECYIYVVNDDILLINEPILLVAIVHFHSVEIVLAVLFKALLFRFQRDFFGNISFQINPQVNLITLPKCVALYILPPC